VADLFIRAAGEADRAAFIELHRHLKPDDPSAAPDVPQGISFKSLQH
jgi:hypothetical protein